MLVKKAIIPAAGLGTRFLPATKAQPKEMLPIVDKPSIQFIVEEAVASGINDILIITNSNKRSIEDHFDKSFALEENLKIKNKTKLLSLIDKISSMANIHYVRQKESKGLGHAILCAKTFINNEPFAVLLGDDIVYNNKTQKPSIKQIIDIYNSVKKTIIGVGNVNKEDVSKYGIIKPRKEIYFEDTYILEDIIEKPEISKAPSNIAVMGRYILTPEIFDIIEYLNKRTFVEEIQLTDAIRILLNNDDVFAHKFKGKRYDIGDKLGFVKATIDFSLRNENISADVLDYIKKIYIENE